ncbi:cob(I)yrinic acid a,c-diamide adenosyltransferase [Desulfonatronovibrio hydrogenovorans]|uniref:cob(I)yrinic acid a,c-diamide adenosyltransferase n=1 Tax=Desulfonatronovibrio hydrogenovorans TaxID=53245 RepID=UPI000A77F0FC|nr:cob(I)yrinic acid a,c-diamide adenosyltransferase [Desulfonatronovibrio hydrogenovorans]
MGKKYQEPGLILVYTGNGKGKTTAAVGQAVRALGSGIKVAFGQFLKRDGQAGEQLILKSLLGNDFLASGHGFYRDEKDRGRHRSGVLDLLAWVQDRLDQDYQLIVLDEAVYALNMGLLEKEELTRIMDRSSSQGTSLVLTGRNVPQWLLERADTVSDILETKHHFQKNISARKGIEY